MLNCLCLIRKEMNVREEGRLAREGVSGAACTCTTWHVLEVPKSRQMMTAAVKLKDACSLEEVMTYLGSILKSRDLTLPTKVRLVKAMVFPVVMYGYESLTIKKAER